MRFQYNGPQQNFNIETDKDNHNYENEDTDLEHTLTEYLEKVEKQDK